MITKQHRQELLCWAYWISLQDYAETSALSTIRVAFPVTSLFSVEAAQTIMQRIQERRWP